MPSWATLKKRLISSAVFVFIAVATIFYAPDWFFFLVVEAFSLMALHEYFGLADKKSIRVNHLTGLLFGALLPVAMYFHAEAMVFAAAVLTLFVLGFDPKYRDQTFAGTAFTIFGLLYVSWLFPHLIPMRDLPHGSCWVFYTVLLVKGGDAGAYFVGVRFGRVKLIEHISPNKSWEGALGGFATTVILSLLSKSFLPSAPVFHLIALGILVGVISQLGDLAESIVKRDVGVKDSGQVPGLGGILDVLDSLIFTVPVVYYYLVFALRLA